MQQADVPVTQEWVGSLDGSVNAQIRAQVTGYLDEAGLQGGLRREAGRPCSSRSTRGPLTRLWPRWPRGARPGARRPEEGRPGRRPLHAPCGRQGDQPGGARRRRAGADCRLGAGRLGRGRAAGGPALGQLHQGDLAHRRRRGPHPSPDRRPRRPRLRHTDHRLQHRPDKGLLSHQRAVLPGVPREGRQGAEHPDEHGLRPHALGRDDLPPEGDLLRDRQRGRRQHGHDPGGGGVPEPDRAPEAGPVRQGPRGGPH